MFRSSFVEDTSNPWSPSSTYINVGSLQNIVNLAEKTGHIDRVSESTFNNLPKLSFKPIFRVTVRLKTNV